MPIFKDMLGADESLFKNELALDYSFIPKTIPYRATPQRMVASCIKPLFQERNGRNALLHGPPGVGKTVACRHLIKEIEEETEDILPLYINCWQKNTSFKIILDICDQLGYKLTHNKRSEELFKIVRTILNKKAAVFVFDEVDKLEDFDFLYTVLEDIYRKSLVLITNHKNWFFDLDQRIKSRLTPESIEFKPYNLNETKGILKERVKYAFVDNVFEDEALNIIAQKTFDLEDMRKGMYLLKESGLVAEAKANIKITPEHAKSTIQKLDASEARSSSDLDDDAKFIHEIIKANSEKKIGDLYKIYQEKSGSLSYKSFKRRVDALGKNNLVKLSKTEGGKEGNTTIVTVTKDRKLTDY